MNYHGYLKQSVTQLRAMQSTKTTKKLIYALAKDLFIPSMGRRTIISPVIESGQGCTRQLPDRSVTKPFCGLYPLSPAHIK